MTSAETPAAEAQGARTTLVEYLLRRVGTAMDDAGPGLSADEVYAVSFLVHDEEDEPMRPTLTVDWNTEVQVSEAMLERRPDDESEARWNYAFWRQEPVVVVGGSADPMGERLCRAWLEAAGLWVHEYDEAGYELADRATQAFVLLCVDAARRLHDDGSIQRWFGRPVPVLVHELEYHDAIAEQALAANPPGLADGFRAWVASL